MQATSEDVFMPVLTGAHSIKSLFLQLRSKVWMQGKIYWSPRPIKPFPARNLRQKEKWPQARKRRDLMSTALWCPPPPLKRRHHPHLQRHWKVHFKWNLIATSFNLNISSDKEFEGAENICIWLLPINHQHNHQLEQEQHPIRSKVNWTVANYVRSFWNTFYLV